MSTVPKADLARALAVYEWLRSANPHLPPANKVALDVLTLEANPHISVSTLTLTAYVDLPDSPVPGGRPVSAPMSPGRGAAAPSPKAGGTAPAGSLTALRTLVDAMHTVAAKTAESSPPQAAQWWWVRHEALGEVLHLIDQLDGGAS